MAPNDPPSPQALATLHYLQAQANYIRTYPATSSEAVRLISYFLRMLIGWDVRWPVPQISGWPRDVQVVVEVAGVTSLQPDALAVLTGAIRLLSGANITLSEAGQDITIAVVPGASQTAHGCRVFNNAAETITTGTVTQLTFNSERDDTNGFHDTAANTSRITIPAGLAGVYQISGAVEFAAGATGVRVVRIRLNGATVIANMLENTATGGNTTVMTISTAYRLAVGDFVELEVFHTQGANLNVNSTANYSPEFMAYMVGT